MTDIVDAPVVEPAVRTVPVKVELAGTSAAAGADLARTTLAVFFMVGLAAAALWILKPFVPALLWATMIVVAMWPLMLRAQARLGCRRWAAVTSMTAALLLVFAIPFSLAVTLIVSHTQDIGEWAQALRDIRVPAPPAWIEQLPVIGTSVYSVWSEAFTSGSAVLTQKLEPYARGFAAWLVGQVGSVGIVVVQFLLTVLLSAILFARGEHAAAAVLGFFRRLAGSHGENVVVLAGRAIRAVALGVIVTALVQSVLGGIGIGLAGVPFPGLLTAFMFLLAVAQIGPAPVLIGAVVWTYWTSDSAWVPHALLVWCIFVGAIDNFLRPILIQRSGDLPLLMVFAGVVGGLLSFGLVGIFLGPVVLAVVYTLLKAWVSADRQSGPEAVARPPSIA
jgi:predicted PurR-regulated permease PerM